MQTGAVIVIFAFAAWIAAAGIAALLKPATARGWIGVFASSHRINWLEQAWRGLFGAALIVRAPQSLYPEVFTWTGWIAVGSSAMLLIIPLRWHAAFAQFWSRTLPLPAVRLAGLIALALVAALSRAALG